MLQLGRSKPTCIIQTTLFIEFCRNHPNIFLDQNRVPAAAMSVDDMGSFGHNTDIVRPHSRKHRSDHHVINYESNYKL